MRKGRKLMDYFETLKNTIMPPVINFVDSYNDPGAFLTGIAMALEEGCAKFNMDVVEITNDINSMVNIVNQAQGKYKSPIYDNEE